MRQQEFDLNIDVHGVTVWEYDNSVNLKALLEFRNRWYAEFYTQFWEQWEDDVFDLLNANDFGLSVWAILLGLPLFDSANNSPPDYPAFGFDPHGHNLNHSNFATELNQYGGISREQRRQILWLRWLSMHSDGSMAYLNKTLSLVFPDNAYAIDGLNMTIRVIFKNSLNNSFIQLLKDNDLIPRPAGVLLDIIEAPRPTFGVANYGMNFDNTYSQFGDRYEIS